MVKSRYFGNLVQKIGTKEEEYDAKNVKALLKLIREKHGEEVYTMAKTSLILVNDENAGSIKGFSTKLSSGDVIKFLPICGGG